MAFEQTKQNPEGVHFDGDFTVAEQNGPIAPSFDSVLLSYSYRIPMIQRAGWFERLAISTPGPGESYLVEETTPRSLGGDLIEWDRVYMEVPPDRTESRGYVYTRQAVVSGDLVEIPIPTTAKVLYQYALIPDSTQIEVLRATKLAKVGTNIYRIGPADDGVSSFILAEDSAIERVKGDIWQQMSIYVARTSIVLNT